MAGFLYFIETDKPKIDPQAVGLGYALAGAASQRQAVRGPGGVAGLTLGEQDRHAEPIGYFPEKQEWRKLPPLAGGPVRWIGLWKESPPRPEDLMRPQPLRGMVSCSLGPFSWIPPTLTEFDETGGGPCLLPTRIDLDDEGQFVTLAPEGMLGELWRIVHPVALRLCGFPVDGQTLPPPEIEDVRGAAVTLLGANYVVGRAELARMGCLTNDAGAYDTVVMASCRGQWVLDAIAQAEKKTAPPPIASGSGSSPGDGG